MRRALRGEHPAVDDRIERAEVDPRVLGVEDRHQVVVGRATRQRREVVGPVDRRAVVDVMGARDDDAPDPGLGQALELGRHALHRPSWLDVRIEQVARDQEEIHLLREGEVDRRLEGRELALALGGRLLAEIVMPGAEVDVRGVDDPEHRGRAGLPGGHDRDGGESAMPARRPGRGTVVGDPPTMVRARRPHDSPLADSDDRGPL